MGKSRISNEFQKYIFCIKFEAEKQDNDRPLKMFKEEEEAKSGKLQKRRKTREFVVRFRRKFPGIQLHLGDEKIRHGQKYFFFLQKLKFALNLVLKDYC